MRLLLSGLSVGLPIEYMRSSRVCDVNNIVAEYTSMRKDASEYEDDVRDATAADINALKRI